jgi:hypothetical protein
MQQRLVPEKRAAILTQLLRGKQSLLLLLLLPLVLRPHHANGDTVALHTVKPIVNRCTTANS